VSVSSGTTTLALGASGAANRLSVGATGLVPGDTIQRTATLSNSGTQDFAGITLTSTATTSSLLDTSTTMGLQLTIEACSVPWVETGTSPAYAYTCAGTTSTVLASTPVIASAAALSNLGSVTAGTTDYLRVTLTFPTSASDTLQGQSSVIGLTFTAVQRVGAAH
jgi:hypothetical protein